MEWVETTAKTVDEAKDLALDQLGVTADEAEFEVLDEPRPGLFGRLRGEARVRARVRPASVRPKQQRRRPDAARTESRSEPRSDTRGDSRSGSSGGRSNDSRSSAGTERPRTERSSTRSDDGERGESPPVADVAAAAETFMGGLAAAFGYDVTTSATVDGNEIEVAVAGESLGLLIGPSGRTLLAVQDLARVAAQRRLGDHDTRLRVDVSGYREKRRVALEKFAATVAEQVRESGSSKALDPMPSADRKIIHDALTAIDGVTSRSEGEDPYRRIVVAPG
jgi:spoIIIJ-associated protein